MELIQFDWLAVVLAVLICLFFYLTKKMSTQKNPSPAFAFPSLKNIRVKSSLRSRFYNVPKKLYCAALFFFLFAFVDPYLASDKEPAQIARLSSKKRIIPTEGIALYLLLDQSGSMSQTISVKKEGKQAQVEKIDLLKQVTTQFILNRPTDLIGLISFARIPRVIAPLTLNHQLLIQDLQALQVVTGQENDGTSLGYAVYKAAHLITATRHYAEEISLANESQYHIKSGVIIAITDGMQDPNYLDKGNRLRTIELEEVAKFAKKERVRLYIINIDSSFATKQFAPHRRQMQKITKMTGGAFYLADESKDLTQIYRAINELEKSQIPQFISEEKREIRYFSFYPYLISAGMICFLLGSLLEGFYFKSTP